MRFSPSTGEETETAVVSGTTSRAEAAAISEAAAVSETMSIPPELRHLGRHELMLPLASGGMATVYLAKLTGTAGFERLVAIKICHPHLRREPEFVAMFVDEARLAAQLHHPKIVPVLDIVESPVLHLVMDYVKGGSLSDLIARAREERVPTTESRPVLLRIVCDMLEGLHAAHCARDTRGELLELVHRDISPQNVLVGVDGIARLTDFGVARARARIASTRPGDVKGKLGYLAPEVLRENRVGVRSDVFASGVLLWEALCHQRLLQEGDASVGAITRPSLVDPAILPSLDLVVRCATDSNPAVRYSSAEAMLESIEASGEQIADHRAVSAFVKRLLAPTLDSRERRLRDFQPSPRDESGGGGDADAGDTAPPRPNVERNLSGEVSPPNTRRRAALAALVAAFVCISLVGWALLSTSTRSEQTLGAAHKLEQSGGPSVDVPPELVAADPELAPSDTSSIEAIDADVPQGSPATASMSSSRMRRPRQASPQTAERYRPESI